MSHKAIEMTWYSFCVGRGHKPLSKVSITTDDAIYLAWIIEAYLELYHSLYPSVMMTPKMHYLIHLPDKIVMYVNLRLVTLLLVCRFGPLQQQWCMRFECKNAQMKSFISKCFTNVPLTVATHHQHWLCYHLFLNLSDVAPFMYEGDQVSLGILLYIYMYMYVCMHKRKN